MLCPRRLRFRGKPLTVILTAHATCVTILSAVVQALPLGTRLTAGFLAARMRRRSPTAAVAPTQTNDG